MKKCIVLIMSLCALFIYAQTDTDQDVVQAILQQNQLDWSVEKISTTENGRIVTLNLNNQDVAKQGISSLGPEIGLLTELRELTINDNDLTNLPAAIFTLSNLRKLQVQSNSLSNLPFGISNLNQLVELDLRNNQIGELPEEIGQVKSLVKLHLWGNNIISLPPEIGNLSSLQELYLKGNRLRNLPTQITKLKLKYIDVLDNKLCNLTGAVDKWLRKFDDKYEVLQKCKNEKRFQ